MKRPQSRYKVRDGQRNTLAQSDTLEGAAKLAQSLLPQADYIFDSALLASYKVTGEPYNIWTLDTKRTLATKLEQRRAIRVEERRSLL
jgi:hypothetical protein